MFILVWMHEAVSRRFAWARRSQRQKPMMIGTCESQVARLVGMRLMGSAGARP